MVGTVVPSEYHISAKFFLYGVILWDCREKKESKYHYPKETKISAWAVRRQEVRTWCRPKIGIRGYTMNSNESHVTDFSQAEIIPLHFITVLIHAAMLFFFLSLVHH